MAMQQWDEHLGMLQVQRKFSDIVALERESRSWKKIMNNGLTSGQLSFLLKAGSDTLCSGLYGLVTFWFLCIPFQISSSVI